MFQVNAVSALDEKWEERGKELFKEAGRVSDYTETTSSRGCVGLSYHQWLVNTFKECLSLKKKLQKILGVKVTIREHSTHAV